MLQDIDVGGGLGHESVFIFDDETSSSEALSQDDRVTLLRGRDSLSSVSSVSSSFTSISDVEEFLKVGGQIPGLGLSGDGRLIFCDAGFDEVDLRDPEDLSVGQSSNDHCLLVSRSLPLLNKLGRDDLCFLVAVWVTFVFLTLIIWLIYRALHQESFLVPPRG